MRAETTSASDFNAFDTFRHPSFLHSFFHRSTETNSALELDGDVLSNQLGISLLVLDLLNVDVDILTGQL